MNCIAKSPSALKNDITTKSVMWTGGRHKVIFAQEFKQIEHIWPEFTNDHNIFLSASYIKTLEIASKDLKGFIYAVVLDDEKIPLACYYFQFKQFNAAESLNYTIEKNAWQKIQNSVKRSVASLIDARGLICGNLLVTGDHGNGFIGESWDEKSKDDLNTNIHHLALEYAKEQGHKVGFVLGKDYESFEPNTSRIDWNAVKVQPNMVLYMRPNWMDMTTYLADMKSKYRKRNRSALKKVRGFKFVEVGVPDIEANIELIYKLYLEIVTRAPFNMFILSKEYFIDIKRNFGDDCDYTFVYDGDDLIAFQINISNHEEYEAHFLGYKHDYLVSHDLYLNLLLNSLRLAIERRKKTVVFSRTAMQIKSSIGAVPEDLYLYLNVRNRLLNKLVKLAFRFFNPPVVFDQRHPFKDAL